MRRKTRSFPAFTLITHHSSRFLVDAEAVDERGDEALGEAAREAFDRGVFLVEEGARVVGELELAAEDVVLVVVEHPVRHLVADCDGGRYRDLEYARAAARVEQHAVEGEALDGSVHDGVRRLRVALDAQSPAAAYDLAHHRLGEARLDLVAQRLILEGGHGDRAYVLGQPGLRHGLVAAAEARRQEYDGGERRRAEDFSG